MRCPCLTGGGHGLVCTELRRLREIQVFSPSCPASPLNPFLSIPASLLLFLCIYFQALLTNMFNTFLLSARNKHRASSLHFWGASSAEFWGTGCSSASFLLPGRLACGICRRKSGVSSSDLWRCSASDRRGPLHGNSLPWPRGVCYPSTRPPPPVGVRSKEGAS